MQGLVGFVGELADSERVEELLQVVFAALQEHTDDLASFVSRIVKQRLTRKPH